MLIVSLVRPIRSRSRPGKYTERYAEREAPNECDRLDSVEIGASCECPREAPCRTASRGDRENLPASTSLLEKFGSGEYLGPGVRSGVLGKSDRDRGERVKCTDRDDLDEMRYRPGPGVPGTCRRPERSSRGSLIGSRCTGVMHVHYGRVFVKL